MSNGPIWAVGIAIVLLSLLACVAYLESFSKMPKETSTEEYDFLPDWGSRGASYGCDEIDFADPADIPESERLS
jgi:hypothetical protein